METVSSITRGITCDFMAFFHGFRGTFRRGCTPSIPVYKPYARHTAVDKIKRVFSRNFLPAFLVDDGTEQSCEIHRALQIDLCFLHFCKANIGARKFGTAQVAFFQLRIAEHGLRKVAAGKIGFFEVRFRKARTAQTDAGKVLLFERTMIEHTVFECAAAHGPAGEVCARKGAARDTAILKRGDKQACARKRAVFK